MGGAFRYIWQINLVAFVTVGDSVVVHSDCDTKTPHQCHNGVLPGFPAATPFKGKGISRTFGRSEENQSTTSSLHCSVVVVSSMSFFFFLAQHLRNKQLQPEFVQALNQLERELYLLRIKKFRRWSKSLDYCKICYNFGLGSLVLPSVEQKWKFKVELYSDKDGSLEAAIIPRSQPSLDFFSY